MGKGKIVIIGAGHVGSHCAYSLCHAGICKEIILIDTDVRKAQSHSLDLADTLAFMPSPAVVRAGDYTDCDDADIVAVAAGVPRLPGQTRLDTLDASIKVMDDILPKLKKTAFEGILITISNPADIVAYYAYRYLGYPRERVFSTGTSLDSARLKRILSEKTGVSPASVQAYSMGEHGDSQMVPFSAVTIGGVPLKQFREIGQEAMEQIQERTRMIGMDIINGKNATEFGIGYVFSDMAKNILQNEKRVMPVSAYLEGEYGQRELCTGVPAVLGTNGIEAIVELSLTDAEKKLFDRSCDIIREYIKKIL